MLDTSGCCACEEMGALLAGVFCGVLVRWHQHRGNLGAAGTAKRGTTSSARTRARVGQTPAQKEGEMIGADLRRRVRVGTLVADGLGHGDGFQTSETVCGCAVVMRLKKIWGR